jgi:hypothetical protein
MTADSALSTALVPYLSVVNILPFLTSYGVRQLSATFDLATWNEEVDNVTVSKKSFVKIDSGDDPKLMFHTPLDRSYLCANIRNMVSRGRFKNIYSGLFVVKILFGWIFKYCVSGFMLSTSLREK